MSHPDPDWTPPRCEHGNIILGCPHDPCLDQELYLMRQEVALEQFQGDQRAAARAFVRETLGLAV